MAFQTSCVSAANIVTGLTFQQDVVADAEGREMVQHGSALFPIACYAENLKSYSVAWHWHEEFEYILAMKGPLTVDVNKTRVTLQTNQGVFLNSGILHAVEHAEKGEALLHSGVFHPRLVGGMDTIFWQKLIRPMLQPDAPAFFLLDGAVPWQAQVLACLREAWQAVAVEPFDYENRVRYYLSAALRLLSTQCVGGKTKVSQQEQIAAERMKQMLRFVEEHYAEELTVEPACAASGRCWASRPSSMSSSSGWKRPPSCSAPPGSRRARSGWSAALQMAATSSRPSGRSSTAHPKNTAQNSAEMSEIGIGENDPMQHSLTQGPITKNILLFALPLMFGNLLQQMYNIADTWVVGRFLGADALAAVGSSYTLMTFLTSILLGLCMGSGAAVSMQYGSGETEKMRQSVFQSFLLKSFLLQSFLFKFLLLKSFLFQPFLLLLFFLYSFLLQLSLF